MSFKMNLPFDLRLMSTPVYRVREEDGVLGRANKNGTITINDKIKDPFQQKNVELHEQDHANKIKDRLLDYDDEYMYHRKSPYAKWQKTPRSEYQDGNPKHWWEKSAEEYRKSEIKKYK
tara:strand:+ start:700 stop:1056 length:357 start_codon:yes stop_codon:yes gene_type:complete